MKISDKTLLQIMELIGDSFEIIQETSNILEATGMRPDLLEKIEAVQSKATETANKIACESGTLSISSGGRGFTVIDFFKKYSAIQELQEHSDQMHQAALDNGLI